MIGNFRMSTDDEIRSLLANPDQIAAVLYPEDESGTDATAEFDVDKAWHAIHFLLCGQPWESKPPLNFIVSGGTPVGDVDVGYGPARVFSSSELSEIVGALESISAAELKGALCWKIHDRVLELEAVEQMGVYPLPRTSEGETRE